MVVTPLSVVVLVHVIVTVIGPDARAAVVSQVFVKPTFDVSEFFSMLHTTDEPVVAVMTLLNSCGAISLTGIDTRFSPTVPDCKSSFHRFP